MSGIKVAIAGTGYIASFHARAIRGLKDVELVGVCDTSLSSAQAFASNWGVPEALIPFNQCCAINARMQSMC